MHIFVAVLLLLSFIAGIAFYKHRAKLKAAAIEEAEQLKNAVKAKL